MFVETRMTIYFAVMYKFGQEKLLKYPLTLKYRLMVSVVSLAYYLRVNYI